jgi:tetratricopeptide (TPR) repeat protein
LLRAGDLSVRTAFSLSYQQLSDDARRLFRRLWLIPAADFGLAAAPALLGRPEPDSESALDELVAASLVETAGPSGRYRLHDLVRVFAGDCLAEDEDERQRDEAEARLLDWVTRSASAAGDVLDPNRGPTSPGQRAAAIGWLEAQQATVLGAARRAVALDRYDQVLSVADALPWYFDLRCQWEAWKELSETALEAAMRSDNLAQQAIHLNHLGLALSQLRRPAEALACHEQASDAARRTGDSTEEGLALDHIATAYRRLERYDKAVDCHLRALDLFHDGGYPRGEAMATNHLGGTLTLAGRHAEALTRHEQALRLFRRLGDRVGEAMALLGMGQALHEMDRIEAASALFEQAIPIFREMDDRWGEGCCLRGLGLAEGARRHYDRASRWLHEADAVFQTLGDVAERAETVRALAMIALAAGDMDALFGAAPSPA